MKLSDRIKDTKNRKCDNNDIDYGYNMAIDDWLPEIIELENKLKKAKNNIKIKYIYIDENSCK